MPDIYTNSRDLNLVWIAPTAGDKRVPSAQELRANEDLTLQRFKQLQELSHGAGLLSRPTFTAAANRGIVLPSGLSPFAPGIPTLEPFPSNVTISLPALANTIDTISRYDYIYLMCCGVVVNSTHDPNLVLAFDWATVGGALQVINKENTRRLRAVWMVVASQGVTSVSAVQAALTSGGITQISNVSKDSGGMAFGTLRVYPLDSALNAAATYEIMPKTMVLVDLLRVWRVQKLLQDGYNWGSSGEISQYESFHLQPTYKYVGVGANNMQQRAHESLMRIFTGQSLRDTATKSRAVYNLINGQNGTNTVAPGVATASPNGSTALANGQRQNFSSQAVTQKNFVQQVITANDGTGLSQATVPFQGNSPAGARFSSTAADHAVYKLDGTNVSNDGTFTGLGTTGALLWTDKSGGVQIGETVIVQAAIVFPAGSGFPASGKIEKVFVNGLALSAANVHEASVDEPGAFVAPVNGESFRVVMGKERCAVHRIYRVHSVASNAAGTVIVPSDANGNIAFISGTNAPAGRIDKPVVTGLAANQTYTLLCYHAPKVADIWQFQFETVRYGGIGDRTWLDYAEIRGEPIVYAHSHGGASSYFLAEGDVQFLPVAFHLPSNTLTNAVKPHQLAYRILFVNESLQDMTSFRKVELLPSAGKAAPKVGTILRAIAGVNPQSKGISGRLETLDGQRLGLTKLPIQCQMRYQLVVACLILKAGDYKLMVATFNEGVLGETTKLDFNTDDPSYCAIDFYNLY